MCQVLADSDENKQQQHSINEMKMNSLNSHTPPEYEIIKHSTTGQSDSSSSFRMRTSKAFY